MVLFKGPLSRGPELIAAPPWVYFAPPPPSEIACFVAFCWITLKQFGTVWGATMGAKGP